MASGAGRASNPASDDPSIIGISNSHHGNSGRQSNQRNHPSSQTGTARQRNQTSQQPRRQYHQQQYTPTTSEKQRQEHWKVPQGNSQQNPLAKDLFGAENNAQFDFQNYDHHQHGKRSHANYRGNYGGGHQHPGGHRGGRNNQNYGRHSKGPLNQEGPGSSQAPKSCHRQQPGNVETPQNGQGGKSTQNLPQKPKPSAPTQQETERQVKYLETLMKNGEKSGSLQITVTEKKGGRKDSKPPEKGSKSATKSMLEDVRKTPATNFSNPLMNTKPADGQTNDAASSAQNISKETGNPIERPRMSDVRQNDNKTGVPTAETPQVEQQEKKKRKRNRERKRKKDKNSPEEKQKQQETTGRPTDIQEKKSEKSTPKEAQKSTNADQTTTAKKEEKSESNDASKVDNRPLQRSEPVAIVKEKTTGAQEDEDVATKKMEELLGLEQAEKRLKKDMIFRLEKKSPTFPDAVYFCKLCSHHLNTIAHAHKHIKDKRHKKETKAKEQDELLQKLKLPPSAALAALDQHLESVIDEEMMSQDDAKERKEVVERLDEVVSDGLPGCRVVLYGSSVTNVGLKTSDVNVDIQYQGEMRTPAVLMKILEILKESDKFTDVQEDFDAKVPRIEITDRQTGNRCLLSLGNVKSVHTTRLLSIFGKIEPATIKLAKLFRLWGQLCQVDRQQDGSLPPHSFTLMTIFYLQQKHGLPVLHEVMAGHDIESLQDTEEEQDVLRIVDGDWWYYPTAPPAGKEDSVKEEAEEDADETAEFSESDDDIDIIFAESASTSVSNEQSNDDVTNSKPLVPVKLEKCFANETKPTLGELWLGLLKFYAAQFDIENLVITIRTFGKVTRGDRGWSHRRIAVEDPCSPKWNLCKPMNSQALFNYFLMRLKHSVFYFHTAHNAIANKQHKTSVKKDSELPKTCETQKIESPTENADANAVANNAADAIANDVADAVMNDVADAVMNDVADAVVNDVADAVANDVTDAVANDAADVVANNIVKDLFNTNLPSKREAASDSPKQDLDQSAVSKPVDHDGVKGNESHSTSAMNNVTAAVSALADNVVSNVIDELKSLDVGKEQEEVKEQKEDYDYSTCYKFTKSSLTNGKVPIIVCSVCKKEGHRKKACPDEVKIKVGPLPPLTDGLRRMLDRVCRDVYELYVPLEPEVKMREKVCSDLLEYLKKNYDEKVQLCLFGSSRNRFTFRGSDLDVCMTFDGNDAGEDLDYTEVIEGLAKVLRKDSDLRQIIPITTAKVPIVKFYHPKANLEGDISLYNLLAQRNTSMVALYATIDERCRKLGYAMKAFVKRCYIGDASRGSLSSYAYILLVIYFLQQRDPPVLPVLQELYEGDKVPEHFIDGWNSWFYENIGNLDKVWPDFRKNRESLGELWIGMLRFYTERFDFSRHVVCIRQKRLLTAFEKEWTSKCICIEDPFDLNHNLGAGVSRKMTNFILKVFVKARERFGTEPSPELNGILNFQNSAAEYFFDADFLMDGQEVPNDRCCRICGKIGHFVKDCPKRRQGRKKGDDGKLREIECFACGKKGHFKKDCPEPKQTRGSPLKEAQFLQHRPLQQMRLILPQRHPMMIPTPLMHNIVQPPPAIIQAKTPVNQSQMHQRFVDHQRHQRPPTQPPQNPQENPPKRNHPPPSDKNSTPGRQNTQPKAKTPQNGNRRQTNNQGGNSPHPGAGGKSPFPSSGPNTHPPPNSRGQNQRPPVNRNLSSDFESDRQQKIEIPIAPRPSHSDPVRHQGPSNTWSATKHHSLGESPSPGAVYTVTEIESQMMGLALANERQRPGDGAGQRVQRHGGGKEEMHPNQSPRYPAYSQGYPSSPSFPPHFGMLPMSPQSPPMYPPRYMPQYSTSPQGRGNPFRFQQEYQRNEGLSRTPPSPMAFNMQGISPPHPGYGYPQQHPTQQRSNVMDPQMELISGQTFVNSNQGDPPRREVHFSAPNNAPPYRSYPPDRQHFAPNAHGQHPQQWGGPNPR